MPQRCSPWQRPAGTSNKIRQMSTRGEELSDENFIVTASQCCINRKRIKLKKGFLLVSCRAWDFLDGALTGSPCKTGFYPGTQNSRCNLITCTSLFPPFLPGMAFHSIKRSKKKILKSDPLLSYTQVGRSCQHQKAGLQVPGARSLFGKTAFENTRLCIWAKSVAFGTSTTFLRKRVLPVLAPQSRAKDSCLFTLKCSDGSVHHFKVSPEDDPEATRKVRPPPPLNSPQWRSRCWLSLAGENTKLTFDMIVSLYTNPARRKGSFEKEEFTKAVRHI